MNSISNLTLQTGEIISSVFSGLLAEKVLMPLNMVLEGRIAFFTCPHSGLSELEKRLLVLKVWSSLSPGLGLQMRTVVGGGW